METLIDDTVVKIVKERNHWLVMFKQVGEAYSIKDSGVELHVTQEENVIVNGKDRTKLLKSLERCLKHKDTRAVKNLRNTIIHSGMQQGTKIGLEEAQE